MKWIAPLTKKVVLEAKEDYKKVGLNCGVIGMGSRETWHAWVSRPAVIPKTIRWTLRCDIVASPKREDDEDEDVPSTPPTHTLQGRRGDLSMLKSK